MGVKEAEAGDPRGDGPKLCDEGVDGTGAKGVAPNGCSNGGCWPTEGEAQEYTLHVDEDTADADKPRTTYKAAKEENDPLTGEYSKNVVRVTSF